VIGIADVHGHARAPPCQHFVQQRAQGRSKAVQLVSMAAAMIILIMPTNSPKVIQRGIWSQDHAISLVISRMAIAHSCDYDHASGRVRDASYAVADIRCGPLSTRQLCL
jgi:hypothetical protein